MEISACWWDFPGMLCGKTFISCWIRRNWETKKSVWELLVELGLNPFAAQLLFCVYEFISDFTSTCCFETYMERIRLHPVSLTNFGDTGHPPEAHGEGHAGAPHSDWCAFWAEKEGRGGAYLPQGANCELFYFLKMHQLPVTVQCWNINTRCFLQERRRSERAEIQRVRAEKEKDRQHRIAVTETVTSHVPHLRN